MTKNPTPAAKPDAVGHLLMLTARAVERLTRIGTGKDLHDELAAAIEAVEPTKAAAEPAYASDGE